MTPTIQAEWLTWPAVRAVMAALAQKGGPDAARFVGGCVRDTLVGRPVGDIDIATRLTPPQVIEALEAAGLKAVPTGIEHGTITAVAERKPFEITTLRRDVETDGRRAVVAFTHDWAEDAARRDFRLNALYVEPDGTLHDPIGGGVADAHAGRIVFVGDPETRIREDYLRVLRFFRFQAWFGQGAPNAEGLAACKRLAAGVEGLSGERVSKELLKLLAAPDPVAAVRLMIEADVLGRLLPGPLSIERLMGMVALTPDPVLRLLALLPGNTGAIQAASTRLRLSNTDRDRMLLAVKADDLTSGEVIPERVRIALYRLGPSAVRDRAFLRGANGERAVAQGIMDEARAWRAPKFPVGGAEAKAVGLEPGPQLGRLLRETENWWIAQDFGPDRDAVLAKLTELAKGRA